MQRIQTFTNWALGLLAVICVIYLVYHGVILLTKFDDDKAQSEAFGSIKTIARVLGGIGVSWIIVKVAFYIVSRFV
jgi:threonine/homoserine/homoserine lactone efflux protein